MNRAARIFLLPSIRRQSSRLSVVSARRRVSSLSRNVFPGARDCAQETALRRRTCAHARPFSLSRPVHQAQDVLESAPDPTRSDLFYHLTTLPHSSAPVYALSFLPALPAALSPNSPAVIGWLPASAEAEGEAGLNDFAENANFRRALHESVSTTLNEGADEVWVNGALQTGEGWMHINDERNLPPLGRTGDPEDIIGSIRVEGGKILPGTYNPMPAYRLVTGDGVVTLTPGIADRFRASLQAMVDEEMQSTS